MIHEAVSSGLGCESIHVHLEFSYISSECELCPC